MSCTRIHIYQAPVLLAQEIGNEARVYPCDLAFTAGY